MVVNTYIDLPTFYAYFMDPHFENNPHLSNKAKLEEIHYSESHKKQIHGLKYQTGALALN